MKKNISTSGRLIRLLFALLLFAYAWQMESLLVLCFGIFTLYEALASWCVLYQLLGKNSCPIVKHKQP